MKKLTRYETNCKLIEHLSKLINENPDMRFGQILVNFDFIMTDCDVYYTESNVSLANVEKYLYE